MNTNYDVTRPLCILTYDAYVHKMPIYIAL